MKVRTILNTIDRIINYKPKETPMKYLTMVLTDKDEAFDMVTKVDHIAFPVKHVMKKPKLSLWEMYKLKKLLELGYERLDDNAIETKRKTNAKEVKEGTIV